MFRPGFFVKAERISPVQFLILLQLRKQPMYGYEILKALREQFGDIWEPKTGTIYPALRRLETRGFVQTELKEEKEFYSLTERGRDILKDAGGLLEGDLEFAEKYYRILPPLHRGRIMEKMMERMAHGRWPIFPPFPPFHPNMFEDKEAQIRSLKRIREAAQKWLQALDERIKELESEGGGEGKSEGA
ncbi:MAG: PadR family transcriptional regulator [Candidatus Hadarchaeum sp.]